MRRPILPFYGHIVATQVRDLSSDQVSYVIPYAERYLIRTDEGKILSQCYSNFLYFMELIEVTVEKDWVIPFMIQEDSLFLFYMLEGEVVFENGCGQELSEAPTGRCYSTMSNRGEYAARFTVGKHIMLYLSLRIDWIKSEVQSFSLLREFVISHQNGSQEVSHMAKIFMNRAMLRTLMRLWKEIPDGQEDPGEARTANVKQLLRAYQKAQNYHRYLVELSTKEKVQEIKSFICTHFYRADITDIALLCERFAITKRSLRRAFKEADSSPPLAYIQEVRLACAKKLLLETTHTVGQIAVRTGFSSSNYFCRLFRKTYGISPQRYREKPE